MPSITFHILDVHSRDEWVHEETETEKRVTYTTFEDDDEEPVHRVKPSADSGGGGGGKMVIHLFGMTAEGRQVRCDVNGFRPYFYVRIPSTQQSMAVRTLRDYIGRHMKKDASNVELEVCEKAELMGFQNGRTIPVVKITVPSQKVFYECRKLFLDPEYSTPALKALKFHKDTQGRTVVDKRDTLGAPFGSAAPTVYEANLDPMLRFLHMRNIQPCGWVELEGYEDEDPDSQDPLLISCDWEDVAACTAPPKPSAPFKMLSWDIECMSNTGDFPQPERDDPIIQIGCILNTLGTTETERHIFVLGGCDPLEGVVVHTYKRERDLLLAWAQWCVDESVNVFLGYNIFGFDERYLFKRCERLGIADSLQIQSLNLIADELPKPWTLEEKRLSSSAMGDNFLYLWRTVGRLRIDVFHYIKRGYPLGSYKLDDTSRHFLGEKVKKVEENPDNWSLVVDLAASKQGVAVGKSIVLLNGNGESITEKCDVLSVDSETGVVRIAIPDDVEAPEVAKWAVVKDDVSPQELFKLHRGTNADRAKIARYCVQDCQLVLDLFKKLEIFNNAMSMANICSVPVAYIFLRGQGIKLESLIFKFCAERNKIVEVLPRPTNSADSYEGAIVLDPTPGLYKVPIGVADFASLYPSTIMSENISHDTIVWVKDYDLEGNYVRTVFGSHLEQFDNLEGVRYTDISFDIFRADPEDTRKNPTKRVDGLRVCRYAQDQVGLIPQITESLLNARKAKRKEAAKETDPFRAALLDAEQNAYKITGNSLYGQLGSGTFKIRFQALAASVTAYARRQIMFSKAMIEMAYGPAANNPRCAAEIIYGDTDSLFVAFHPKNPETGEALEGRAAMEATVELTEEAGKFVTKALKHPHDFEFDKVYWPFIIFSKKRYVGYKYEDIAKPGVFTPMGLALKRRDYAPIVKKIYGGAIHTILNELNVAKAVEFVKEMSQQLIRGDIGMKPLVISKSLRAEYANPAAIAHKALADRIEARQPGNGPVAGDRIPYVYILPPVGQKASDLQADRIETPAYIKEKGLKIDYMYYIEHQISSPVCQLFGQLLEEVPGYVPPSEPFSENEDVRNVQRERLAYELLFRDAKQANEMTHKRAFFGLFSSASTSASTTPSNTFVPRRSTRLAQKTEGTVRKTQSTLDSSFMVAMQVNMSKTAKAKAKAKEKAKET